MAINTLKNALIEYESTSVSSGIIFAMVLRGNLDYSVKLLLNMDTETIKIIKTAAHKLFFLCATVQQLQRDTEIKED